MQALARKRGLAEERIVPQREVQEADAEAQAAEAALAAARATLESLGIGADGGDGGRFFLKAPVNGTVLDRQVVQGQVVEPGRVLFKVGDLARLWLVAHASERDALQVRVGSAARVAYPALPGEPFEARVSLVGRMVDAGSRTIPVRLLVANTDDRLRPGMSATVWLPVGDEGRLLTVPAAALQRLHDSWCVFVPRAEGALRGPAAWGGAATWGARSRSSPGLARRRDRRRGGRVPAQGRRGEGRERRRPPRPLSH